MKQQHTLQPILRFPEFEGDWEKSNLGNISKKPKYGLNSSATEYDGINGYLRITDIDESSNKFIKGKLTSPDSFSDEFLLKERDLIFTRTGASTGKSYLYSKEDGKLYFAGFLIKFSLKDICNDKFVFYQTKLVRYSKWVKIMSMRSGQPGINSEEYSTLDIILPSLPEQQKIADYLSTIDTKINLLEEKKAQLGLYKKAMMQKLFAQEIRFKDDNGNDFPEWENSFGGDIFISHTNKNHNSDLDVLAITQEHGAIPRNLIDYKVQVSNESVNNYKVVEKDDFIISLRSFQGGIEHSNYIGICSPAYIILRNIKPIEPLFYKAFFKSRNYINYLNRTLEGIRDGKMISYSNFAKSKLPYPSLPEQQKIADFLSAIDESIEKVTEQISQTQSFKKAMLQGMFV